MVSLYVREEWSLRFLGFGDFFVIFIGIWKMFMFFVSSLNVELFFLFKEEYILGKEVVRFGGICFIVLGLSSTWEIVL